MDHLPEIIAIVCVFGIPLSGIWTYHRRKMLEMQLQMRGQGDSSLHAEVEALRTEVRSLRDTSTQYDISFDTALQRMESRVAGVERHVEAIQSDNVLQVGSRR